MGYMRIGSCNHCGKCCKPPVIVENPVIELGQDRCKFYVDTENTAVYGHCLIHGRGNRPIRNVRDRSSNKITEAQIKWFNDNCIDFPSTEDLQTGRCPPECSFAFEVVIDG